ncbi:DUF4232 domain-containing protein [Streptomyces sp. NPDC051740]|uniref:DUF4232 domain-containing protein n=1 Tax=Streptomyces sp. NPDC051740 TaxID=3365673 RepID=UPI00378E2410
MGAAALTALLAVTACEPGAADTGGGTTPGPSESRGEETATATATACSDADLSITTAVYPRDEVRHLLLTSTNTGDEECALFRHPVVRFDGGPEDQVGPMESEMQDPVIAPGGKAYAGMLLFRIGAQTDAVETMTVTLQGGAEDTEPIEAPLPDGTTFLDIDDNPLVTCWNADRETTEKTMFQAAGGT